MIPDEEALSLLKDDPGLLVVLCSDMIKKTVHFRLIQKKWFNIDEMEDLYQEVTKRLLERIPVIQRQYKGKARLSTYLVRIIINICNEICREKKKELPLSEIPLETLSECRSGDVDEISETDFKLITGDAFTKFDQIIETYPISKKKLILFLKILYECPVHCSDLEYYCKTEDIDNIQNYINNHCHGDHTKTKRYAIMTDLVLKYEGKSNSTDAIRKWLEHHIKVIIRLLNFNQATHIFDEPVFRLFFERYCYLISEKGD